MDTMVWGISQSCGTPETIPREPSASYATDPDDLNRYAAVKGQALGYDDNGNLTSDGTFTYHWTSENELDQVKDATDSVLVARYRYGPFGRRIRKTLGPEGSETDTWYVWSGDRLFEEHDDAGSVAVRYVYGKGFAPVRIEVDDGQGGFDAYGVHRDHLDTRLLTDAAGLEAWRADYEAFGQAVETSASGIAFNLRFPGQYFDAETGLHYNRFRYYDPSIGRYISADPIGQIASGDPNLYAYVWNDPLNWIDPLGLRVLNPNGYTVSPEVMSALEAFNAFIGCDKDIVITGGDRPASSKIGSGSKSQHAQSKAADIKVPGQSHLTTANQAKSSNQFGGVGWYEEGYSDPATGAGPHVHVDTRDGVAEWGYDKDGNYYNWQKGGDPRNQRARQPVGY